MSSYGLNENDLSMADEAQKAHGFRAGIGRIWPSAHYRSQDILVNLASSSTSLAQVALLPVSSRPRPTFFDIFDESQYPVFTRICELIPVDSILALNQTCKSLSNLYQRIQPTQWNIDRRLGEYFRDPSQVRSLMGECDALISGRFAVEFFERTKFPAQRLLEIYVEASKAERLVSHLVEVENYLKRKQPMERCIIPNGVCEFSHYERESWPAGGRPTSTTKHQIKITITRVSPVVAIINLGRHSTICVNIISWNKAYAIFPKSSFIAHKGFLAHVLDGKMKDDYSRYGWRTQDVQWIEDAARDKSFCPERRVGDKNSWVIGFDTTNVSWSATPDFVLEYAVFSIEINKLNPTGLCSYYGYKISTGNRTTAFLRYRYAIPGLPGGGRSRTTTTTWTWAGAGNGDGDGDGDGNPHRHNHHHVSWKAFLNQRLNRLAPIAIAKLPPDARPTRFSQILNGEIPHCDINPATFTKSDDWVYWDDQIPSWYKVWEESKNM